MYFDYYVCIRVVSSILCTEISHDSSVTLKGRLKRVCSKKYFPFCRAMLHSRMFPLVAYVSVIHSVVGWACLRVSHIFDVLLLFHFPPASPAWAKRSLWDHWCCWPCVSAWLWSGECTGMRTGTVWTLTASPMDAVVSAAPQPVGGLALWSGSG